jgi:hypothetical protein
MAPSRKRVVRIVNRGGVLGRNGLEGDSVFLVGSEAIHATRRGARTDHRGEDAALR